MIKRNVSKALYVITAAVSLDLVRLHLCNCDPIHVPERRLKDGDGGSRVCGYSPGKVLGRPLGQHGDV
jgi:hypothetical protein